jgi:pimeloyl-ACP methyl ester carboxylesterase
MQSTTTTHEIAYSDTGVGDPALLCLPGWCGGREVFAPLLASAAHTRRALSVDWPGHGASPQAGGDFGSADLVQDTLALVAELGLERVVPVALSHAGWIALELRRALGAERVPAVVLMDWMPLGTPPGFLDALGALQDPAAWSQVRAQLFSMWGAGVDSPSVHDYIATMGEYGYDMWSRAGREIARSFDAQPVPLAAFAALPEKCPTLHVYAQPRDEGYLAVQEGFAAEHHWFQVRRLDATSHFPCLEVPDEIATAIDEFLARTG